MHTLEVLEESLALAEQLGYRIRREWLGGIGGGACEFGGRKWIFVDLALNTIEQVDQVLDALNQDPAIYQLTVRPPIRQLLQSRPAA